LEGETRAVIHKTLLQQTFKSKGDGHIYVSQGMKEEPILQMGADKITLRHVYDKPFRFPDGSEQDHRFQPNRKGGQDRYTVPRQIRTLGLGVLI
jgi:hypothetical protein